MRQISSPDWHSLCRDRPSTPFRCLDAQYRRELVRVYLTNVETICRKFVDEKRESLAKLREDTSGFRLFLGSLDPRKRRALATEKGEGILKVSRPLPLQKTSALSWGLCPGGQPLTSLCSAGGCQALLQ